MGSESDRIGGYVAWRMSRSGWRSSGSEGSRRHAWRHWRRRADRCRRSRTLVEYIAAVRAHMASMDPLNEGLSDLLEVPSARTYKW
jgi:hypothetical protein